MDRDEWDKWLAGRCDNSVSYTFVKLHCANSPQRREGGAEAEQNIEEIVDFGEVVDFVEEVEVQAEDVYQNQGVSGLRDEREVIDERLTKLEHQYQRVQLWIDGFKSIAVWLHSMRSELNCTGRLDNELEVAPRGTLVENAESIYEIGGPPLALRPRGDEYNLEPTLRTLKENGLVTNAEEYPFRRLTLPLDATFENAIEEVQGCMEEFDNMWRTLYQRTEYLEARKEVYDNLITRHVDGREMPWEKNPSDSHDAIHKPDSITDPPDDLFKGRGTKDRTKGKKYARELAKVYKMEEDIPKEWTKLHPKVEGEKKGRSKVRCVRNAFEAHPEVSVEPENPESLCQACYHFFDDISLSN